jgi:hypothetical protein
MRKLKQWREEAKHKRSALIIDTCWLWWWNALLALSLLPTANVWGFYG